MFNFPLKCLEIPTRDRKGVVPDTFVFLYSLHWCQGLPSRGRSRGRVQGVRNPPPPPPRDDLRLSNRAGILQKNSLVVHPLLKNSWIRPCQETTTKYKHSVLKQNVNNDLGQRGTVNLPNAVIICR